MVSGPETSNNGFEGDLSVSFVAICAGQWFQSQKQYLEEVVREAGRLKHRTFTHEAYDSRL